ncbi:MAG TPA: hypothetical protein VIV84_06280 [Burkholderiaceae bacterium]
MWTLWLFGVAHEYTSVIEQHSLRHAGATLAAMVNPFRRWFGRSRDAQVWAAAAEWAEAGGHRFARSRDGSGFIVEAGEAASAWRLEWGSAQRHYFDGPELRLRADVGATGDLQMLVIGRELMVRLEQQVFEESTDGTETRMDDDLPEEMRWLVLYSKLPRAELGVLRERFGALANLPGAALSWLDPALTQQLDATTTWLSSAPALLLVLQRGRLTLRCALAQPEVSALKSARALFDAALSASRRVGAEIAQGSAGGDRPSNWGPRSAMPIEVPPR